MSHLEGLSVTVMPTVAHIFSKAEDGGATFGWVIGRILLVLKRQPDDTWRVQVQSVTSV